MFGQVGRDSLHVAKLGQLPLRLCTRVCFSGADDDTGARPEKPARDHQTDSPRPTGDEGVLPGQIEQACMRRKLTVRH